MTKGQYYSPLPSDSYPLRSSLEDDAEDHGALYAARSRSQARASWRAYLPFPDRLTLGRGGAISDDEDQWWKRTSAFCISLYKQNVGFLLIALSQFFGACMNCTVKFLSGLDPPIPPLELVAIRMVFTYFFSVFYMRSQKVEHPFFGPPGVRLLLTLRGVSGFFGLFGMYYSLQYLSLSDAVVLTFLIPTCTAISGCFLLGEGYSRGQTVATVVSLVGVVFIARPEFIFGPQHTTPFPSLPESLGASSVVNITHAAAAAAGVIPSERGTAAQRLGAVGVAMLGVIGGTGAVTCMRAIGTRAHALHSLTYFSSYSILVSIVGMIVLRVKPVIPGGWQPLLFFVIGLFGYGAQVSLAVGLQKETVSRGMLAMYIQIVFASILERIFFHTTPSLLSFIATVLILSCAIYVAVSKRPTPSQNTRVRLADPEANEAAHLSLSTFELGSDGDDGDGIEDEDDVDDDNKTVYSIGTNSPPEGLSESATVVDLQALPLGGKVKLLDKEED